MIDRKQTRFWRAVTFINHFEEKSLIHAKSGTTSSFSKGRSSAGFWSNKKWWGGSKLNLLALTPTLWQFVSMHKDTLIDDWSKTNSFLKGRDIYKQFWRKKLIHAKSGTTASFSKGRSSAGFSSKKNDAELQNWICWFLRELSGSLFL